MTRQFTIEIRDYESGEEPDRLNVARVEKAIRRLLERDGSDGVVIVKEAK